MLISDEVKKLHAKLFDAFSPMVLTNRPDCFESEDILSLLERSFAASIEYRERYLAFIYEWLFSDPLQPYDSRVIYLPEKEQGEKITIKAWFPQGTVSKVERWVARLKALLNQELKHPGVREALDSIRDFDWLDSFGIDWNSPPDGINIANKESYDSGKLYGFFRAAHKALKRIILDLTKLEQESKDLLAMQAENEFVFCSMGDYRVIRFEGGEPFLLTDTKGLRYIERLLDHQPKPLPVLLLDRIVSGTLADRSEKSIELASSYHLDKRDVRYDVETPLTILHGVGPRINDASIAVYMAEKPRLKSELEAAREDGDGLRAADIQDDLDHLDQQLISGRNLTGRPRLEPDDTEKRRKAVSNCINRDLKRIKVKDERLFAHLQRSIRCGRHCVYTPERYISWDL